jgi:hypothetical protein
MASDLLHIFRGLAMATGLALAPVGARGAPMTALACLPETPLTAPVCAALHALIRASRPDLDLVLTPASALDAYPDALRLHIVRLRDDGIAARLDWRRAGQDWQRGADMAMNVMDSPFSQPMMHQFLQSLWTQSPAGL